MSKLFTGELTEMTPLCPVPEILRNTDGNRNGRSSSSNEDVSSTDGSVDIPDFPPMRDSMGNNSIFFDRYTSASFEEMKNSALEACCPGDGIGAGSLGLLTSAVTPTMLSIPLAFAVGGFQFAAASIVFCMIVTFLSVRILALASASAATEDYESVAGFFLGYKGKWIARGILFFYNFGCSVVYLCFIKNSVTSIISARATFLPYWLRGDIGGVLSLIALMVAITPLTFNSRLASLRTKGFISNILIVFIIGAVVYRYFYPETSSGNGTGESEEDPVPHATSKVSWLLPYLFVGPIFVFSYEVQSNVMSVIKDLHDYTGRRILICISTALLIATTFYATLGVFGSRSFNYIPSGNILSNYDLKHDLLMLTCQVFCCFSASVSFVFCIFPCRSAVFMLLSDGKSTRIPRQQRVRIGVILSTLACLVAVFLSDVAVVVSVLGALFSASLSMTFPALFGMYMRSSGTYLTSRIDGFLIWILLALGISFSAVGTFMAVFFGTA